jgi:hypothetical protein
MLTSTFVAGTTIRTRGMRKFTPQMVSGATCDEGTYHFMQVEELAISLMTPSASTKHKRKKNVVKTFTMSTNGRLAMFTCEIFGIPLSK